MPDNVKVPLLGNTPKGAVMAGGLAVVGVSAYLLYKHFTKPKGTPYASAYGQYGAYGAYGQYGMAAFGYGSYSPYGTYGFGGGGGGFFPQYYQYGSQGPQGPGPITTNQEWFQAAIASLGSTGTDKTGRVLSSYIFGLPVSKDDEMIVQEAEAFNGPPPVSGVGGYPPKIHVVGDHKGQPPPPQKDPTTVITVHRTGTLSSIARSRGWGSEFLSDVESMNHLHASSIVHKGQKLTVPKGSVTSGS